ncbi:hypothetical protein ES288_A07G095200v1 [Gossypium darwinii]|uniref:Uncharacterized protein n=1 Tax=Gossypium darwinii TaxID=34276 RepID=A0A5D2FXH4_GOSDA|nr:hypothetical protein ES288_A07G095200v1 [Gossypium darwinii]
MKTRSNHSPKLILLGLLVFAESLILLGKRRWTSIDQIQCAPIQKWFYGSTGLLYGEEGHAGLACSRNFTILGLLCNRIVGVKTTAAALI